MSRPPLNVGLLGGNPAALAYQAAVQATSGIRLIVAPAPDLMADPAVAAVIVAAVPAGDAGIVPALLASGKHVLLDPGTLGLLAAGDKLPATGGSLLIARPWRDHEICRSLRAVVEADDLGPAAFFQWVSEDNLVWPAADPASDSELSAPAVIGIDLAHWLLGGRPARVYARATGAGAAAISLRFPHGANALLEHRAALAAAGTGYGAAWLLGPRGEARWEQRADDLTIDGGGTRLAPLDFRPGLAGAVAHAVACWHGDADLAAATALTGDLLATISAVNESLRSGQPAELPARAQEPGR